MSKPIVLMAFANERVDNSAYLRNLPKEQRIIYTKLRDAERDGHCELVLLPYATTEQIFNTFQDQEYRDRIAIFHFGGHANSYQLLLESEQGNEAANADGFIQFLAQQKSLKLIFLNGCSTEEQALKLIEKGLPNVIGTSSSIHDDIATLFAERFYTGISQLLSINQAFQDAESFLITKKGAANKRDFYWDGLTEVEDVFPWKLYVAENQVANWALSSKRKTTVHELLSQNGRIKRNESVNEHIISPVYQSIIKFSPKLAKDEDDYDDSDEFWEEVQNVIIKSFPLPISTQLRKLFAYSDEMVTFGLPRLEQLAKTYSVSSQFCAFVLLAQLWDAKHQNQHLQIEGKTALDFHSFFTLADDNWQLFNYVSLLRAIAEIFEQNKIEPFISELSTLAFPNQVGNEVFDAYNFLEKLRLALVNNSISAEEVAPFCQEGEYHLSILLQHIAFLVNYRLVTVKDIHFEKVRYQEPEYAHTMGVLRGMEGSRIKENVRCYDDFSESHSIIIVRNIKQIEDRLNLSPFLIDVNAFTLKHTPNFKIHFYRYPNSDKSLTYEFLDVKDEFFNTQQSVNNIDKDKLLQLEDLYQLFLKDFGIKP